MGFIDVFKRVLGPLKRPFKNYNVAHRAEKVLRKQEKVPNPAPKHASSITPIKQFREENPELLQAMQTKSDDLHERLKSVYLNSEGSHPEIKRVGKEESKDNLPKSGQVSRDEELSVMDIDYSPPEGKVSLKTALEALNQHMTKPDLITAEVIAKEHHLDKQEVEDMLQHFQLLQIFIPKNSLENDYKGIQGKLKLTEQVNDLSSFVKLPNNVQRKDAKNALLHKHDLSERPKVDTTAQLSHGDKS